MLTFAAILIAISAGGGCGKQAAPPQPATVTIGGTTWSVEIAATPGQRYEGLSGRDSVPAGRGMLFVFPQPQEMDFCMRGCVVPIDVAFISPQGRVVSFYTMSVEPDRAGKTLYSSKAPARYALEVAGGALARAGVKTGDAVTFSGSIPEGS